MMYKELFEFGQQFGGIIRKNGKRCMLRINQLFIKEGKKA